MRHLLASSAVAGLLFLLPAGSANAQDNRDSFSWIEARGVVLSLITIAAAGGAAGGSSIASYLLWRRKGKRDDAVDKKLENVLNGINRLTGAEAELNSSIKILDTKLDSVNELTSTLEKKIDTLSNENEALNDLEQEQEKFRERLRKCEDEKELLNEKKIELQKLLKNQESNTNKQWKIMKDQYKEDERKNQKTSPINYLKLIKSSNCVNCYDCLDAVKKLCPDSLEVLPEADDSAKDHKNFKSIDQLFKMLWKLGTTFQEKMLKAQKNKEELLNHKAGEEIFGRKYAPIGDKRCTVEYKGKILYMPEHLKIDNKNKIRGKERAPDNGCLRIHFSWDAESKKVVIGHCGKHL